jgi:hypothetical protein
MFYWIPDMRGFSVVCITLLAAGLIIAAIDETLGADHGNRMKKRDAPATTKKPATTEKPWPNSNGHNACRCGKGKPATLACARAVHSTPTPYCYNAWFSHYCEIYSQKEYDHFHRCCNDRYSPGGGLECRW